MEGPNYDYDQLFPGRFLKSGEFDGKEVTLTIGNVELEEMEDRKGMRVKPIVTFRETKRQMVLNRTNAECLKGLFGRKVADWVGKRVTFYPITVEAFGAPTLAIRVKGSPDISRDVQITVKVGRQGDAKVMMRRTGAKASANGKAAQTPAPSVGEPPPDVPLPGATREPGEDDVPL